MITVSIQHRDPMSLEERRWLQERDVRIIGWGGKVRGYNEVMMLPYVIQRELHPDGDEIAGIEFRFTDDLSELAMLFKLTFA